MVVMKENVFIYRRHMLKFLGAKCHEVYSFQMVPNKSKHMKREREKHGRILIVESR